MKEDMGKIQKDNKQGVVCIRCVRVLCRPSSRYRKAGTGLYTKKRDFLLHYSGAKKSPVSFFCTTTQGGHAMKKILEVFQRAAKRRIFYYGAGIIRNAGAKNPGNMWGKYTGRGKKTRASEGDFCHSLQIYSLSFC